MDLDWSEKGKLKIGVIQYNKDTVNMWPEALDKKVNTPAGKHILKINPDCPKLDEKRARLFHTLKAINLLSRKRSRGDILMATAFHTTRVKAPDKDNLKKIGRTLQYMKDMPNAVLTLSANNIQVIKWWVDGSYACNEDC